VTGNSYVPSVVAGIGINVPPDPDASLFRKKFGVTGPFLLYVGRLHPGKNVPELIDYFLRFRAMEGERPLKLVLAGKSHIHIPEHPDIIPLGYISEEDKFNAIKAASVVVMPSLYESLSMIVLEAWLMGRPVLVNGRCEVLRRQCRRSNGGLYYNNFAEFKAVLTYLLQTPEIQTKLGQQGWRFATTHYQWSKIIDIYRQILQKVIPSP
jgi:glycosyltransferase involved in cell wall biosynthesis